MKHSILHTVLVTTAFLLPPQFSRAEVVDSSAHGFTVRSSVTVNTSSQELGALGAMTIAFAEKDSKTEVTMTYAVGGYMKQGLGFVAGTVDYVLEMQLSRYRAHADNLKQ